MSNIILSLNIILEEVETTYQSVTTCSKPSLKDTLPFTPNRSTGIDIPIVLVCSSFEKNSQSNLPKTDPSAQSKRRSQNRLYFGLV